VHLYRITDRVEEAVEEVIRFYRVYHSMRYVNEELVLRISRPLPEPALAALNQQFADIVVSGTIRQGSALPGESNEPELAGLPRLILHFDRRCMGRLRQLIDFVNLQVDLARK
jgi:hypothetical protein